MCVVLLEQQRAQRGDGTKPGLVVFFFVQKTRWRSINNIEMSRPLSPRLAGLQRQYCP